MSKVPVGFDRFDVENLAAVIPIVQYGSSLAPSSTEFVEKSRCFRNLSTDFDVAAFSSESYFKIITLKFTFVHKTKLSFFSEF